ncbi:MAG: hypothetical protein JXD22_16490 [Sedimentisphaerales bacterium]|nr:hypothetical protein [Sedimentisphaerales bacterium]
MKMIKKTNTFLIIGLSAMLLFLSGCNLLTYPAYILFGQTHQSVKAEYRGLTGKKIAIIVAGQPAIEFDQPYARMDLALVSAQSISDHIKNVTFADQDQIDRFQRESLDWYSVSISEIARKFDAEVVLYIDLIQFTTAEIDSINLLRGRIWAQVSVYDMSETKPDSPKYETEVQVIYPEEMPLPISDSTSIAVRQNTLLMFADELARKFYDHKKEIRK